MVEIVHCVLFSTKKAAEAIRCKGFIPPRAIVRNYEDSFESEAVIKTKIDLELVKFPFQSQEVRFKSQYC